MDTIRFVHKGRNITAEYRGMRESEYAYENKVVFRENGQVIDTMREPASFETIIRWWKERN